MFKLFPNRYVYRRQIERFGDVGIINDLYTIRTRRTYAMTDEHNILRTQTSSSPSNNEETGICSRVLQQPTTVVAHNTTDGVIYRIISEWKIYGRPHLSRSAQTVDRNTVIGNRIFEIKIYRRLTIGQYSDTPSLSVIVRASAARDYCIRGDGVFL